MAINIVFYIVFAVAGLIIGSFLNVVIYRIPRKLSLVRPGSHCPECKEKIKFYDNIPLLSYLVLKGRCRYCSARIPIKYPLIEIATAVFFIANYVFFGLTFMTLLGTIFCCILIIVTMIDIEFRIIPNVLILPALVIGLLINIFLVKEVWWKPLAFSAGSFVFMLIIHLIYPKGMGLGDVKFSAVLGAFLSQAVVVGLFLGFLFGSLFGLVMIIVKKRRLKQTIPFGPFLSLGSLFALFWGRYILKWYLSFF